MFKIKNPLASRKPSTPAMPVLTERAEQIFRATGGAPVRTAKASAPKFAYIEAGSFNLAVEALKRVNVKHAAGWDDNLGGHVITLQ